LLASFPDYATVSGNEMALPSFADAVEEHKAMVYSIAWHFLRDHAAAEELAQEVFLQLHRSWASMKSPEHVVSWLRRVATHRAIDFVRRARIRSETSLEETTEPTVLERVHDTFLSAYLERMVASLPEKQRLVIILRYQEDMDVEEIARTLDMKPATVKTQLARGLALLQAKTARRLANRQEQNAPVTRSEES
jgi:RNA polymerase sigma-70 factor (ECF subfamily)